MIFTIYVYFTGLVLFSEIQRQLDISEISFLTRSPQTFGMSAYFSLLFSASVYMQLTKSTNILGIRINVPGLLRFLILGLRFVNKVNINNKQSFISNKTNILFWEKGQCFKHWPFSQNIGHFPLFYFSKKIPFFQKVTYVFKKSLFLDWLFEK